MEMQKWATENAVSSDSLEKAKLQMRQFSIDYLQKRAFLQELKAFTPIQGIILYGSRARGDCQERSDIDLAIECPKIELSEWLKVLDIIEEADTLLKIDCICLNDVEVSGALKEAILREGFICIRKMKNTLEESFQKLNNAIKALKVMVDKPQELDRSNMDACMHRFEFTIELFWKLLRRILAVKGREVYLPKDILKESYASKLIDDEVSWLGMLKDRNLTSHTYNEQLADAIYQRIKIYYPIMKKTFDTLSERYNHSIQN